MNCVSFFTRTRNGDSPSIHLYWRCGTCAARRRPFLLHASASLRSWAANSSIAFCSSRASSDIRCFLTASVLSTFVGSGRRSLLPVFVQQVIWLREGPPSERQESSWVYLLAHIIHTRQSWIWRSGATASYDRHRDLIFCSASHNGGFFALLPTT
jgi:hypothetical protein